MKDIFIKERYDHEGRTKKARDLMQKNGVDCLYLTSGRNQAYFAGAISGRAGWPNWLTPWILPLEGDSIRVSTPMIKGIVSSRFPNYLGKKWYLYIDGDEVTARNQLKKALRDLKVEKGTIGVAEEMRYTDYLLLQDAAPDATIKNVSETILDPIRMIKDHLEISNIRKSAEIADRLYEKAAEIIKSGASVYDLRVEFAKVLIDFGADSATIRKGELDHKLQEGDWLDFEPVPRYKGYGAETARSFFVGPEPGRTARLLWKAIEESYDAIMDHVKPGVTMNELDITFRDSFKESLKELKPNFIRTRKVGHGMGMGGDGHEKPFVQEFNMTKAVPGMVFVIDPGCGPNAFPDKYDYGIRGTPGASIHLISTVLITENGYEVLDKYPTDIQICY